MPDPQPLDSPVDRVRAALASPGAVDLASPILARDTAELTRRLRALRRRGGPYAGVATSPHLGRLVLALETGGPDDAGKSH